MAYRCYQLQKEIKLQKNYFLKTLCHDFRVATIAQIRGLDLLQKESINDSRHYELLTEINNSCKYSLDMISMLINTYKLENGEQILNNETFNLYNTTELACRYLLNMANEKHISFYLNINNNHQIEADKYLFTKLISILTSTAVNYSNYNNTITFSSAIRNNFLELSITYQGKPLSEEEIQRMFSLNTRYSTVGHGIKMHLCKKIIDFHKGKICIQKKSNNLNCFTILLPLLQNLHKDKKLTIRELQTN